MMNDKTEDMVTRSYLDEQRPNERREPQLEWALAELT
jgi:hypothetical protein